MNNLYCSWVIAPLGAVSISISVTNLDLGFGDALRIYRGSDATGILVAEYLRGATPTTLNVEGGKAFVEFVTDGISVGQGWQISYSPANAPCIPPQH